MSIARVVLTRPEPECSQLAARLRKLGFSCICLPAFDFESTGKLMPLDLRWRSALARLAVFTSPRAVEHALVRGQVAELAGATLAAIGPATAAALAARGLKVDCLPAADLRSETLLQLPELPRGPGEALVVTGVQGRTVLSAGLEELGWNVRVAEVYRRILRTPPAAAIEEILTAEGTVVSVWTSGAALAGLLAQLPGAARARLLSGPLVTVSPRLVQLAQATGARDVHLAAGPGNEELLAAVSALGERV